MTTEVTDSSEGTLDGAKRPQTTPVSPLEDNKLREEIEELLYPSNLGDSIALRIMHKPLLEQLLSLFNQYALSQRITELKLLFPKLEQGYSGGAFVLRATKIEDRIAELKSSLKEERNDN